MHRRRAVLDHAMTSFPTTHWSFITQLRDASGASREQMVASFLSRYLPPMAAYLRFQYRQLPSADLEDLMQDFVADRVIRRSVLDYARENRGPLRVFLRACLNNFAKTWLGRRSRARTIRVDDIGLDRWHPGAGPGACPFDVAWARHVILQGVERLREECEGGEGSLVWAVFEARMYLPMLDGETPTPYQTLSVRLEVESKALANLLTTAKRKLKHHLLDVIGDYTVDAGEAEGEIRDLFRILADGRGDESERADDAE